MTKIRLTVCKTMRQKTKKDTIHTSLFTENKFFQLDFNIDDILLGRWLNR